MERQKFLRNSRIDLMVAIVICFASSLWFTLDYVVPGKWDNRATVILFFALAALCYIVIYVGVLIKKIDVN